VFLQGSQNYGLSYENSDVDSKAVLLPKFSDFVLRANPVSTTHVLDNDEHIDLKDIRLMFDCFQKQNINFVEILFTKHKVLNPKYAQLWNKLCLQRERIARFNNYAAVNCMSGMSMEKLKALEHPYPATMDKIEKYGYDPKQLHHILRLNEFIKRYVDGVPYEDCLVSAQRNYLIDVKRGCHNLDAARRLAKEMDDSTKCIKQKYMDQHSVAIDGEVKALLDSVLVDIIKTRFREEVLSG
jgi:predicted nucleotidyltransferase